MRRATLLIGVLVFMVSVFVSLTALCQDKSNQDGYAWESMGDSDASRMARTLMVAGYLRGYAAAYPLAYGEGLLEGFHLFDVLIEMPKDLPICGETWKEQKKTIGSTIGLLSASRFFGDKMFREAPEYYVREVSSFLKTYPLCRRWSIQVLLFELVQVWKTDSSISYKDVGEKCSQQNK